MRNIVKDKYLLFDGAMGTYYATKRRPYSLTQANLLDYSTIVSIHSEYIAAGAMAITTNTFGIIDPVSAAAAFKAASDAARNTSADVFCSLGPLRDENAYTPVIDALLAAGAMNFIFETFPSADIPLQYSAYIRKSSPEAFIIVSFAADQNGYTSSGRYYIDLIAAAQASSAIDAAGLNCACGPSHIKMLTDRLDKSRLLSVMPNAGYPDYTGDTPEYRDNPEYFAEKLAELYKSGVRILGGCCGTTPRHIRAAARLLRKAEPGVAVLPKPRVLPEITNPENPFQTRLISGKKLILVEYDPPLSADAAEITEAAQRFEEAGADAVTIADNPLGRARADSLLVASRVKRETSGITVIPHLTCRDRNAVSIRSALLGLKLEGIDNLLCVTGDPLPSHDIKILKAVYSFNSESLLEYAGSIGAEIGYNYFTGAALNVNANRFELELARASKKKFAGAKYFITQPCFSERSAGNAVLALESLGLPLIAGIMPLKNYKNALFCKSEISGIDIPDGVPEMYIDKTPAECEEVSVKLALGMVKRLLPNLNGVHIITPPRGENIVEKLIREIKKL